MDFNLVQSYILKLPDLRDLKSTPRVQEIIKKYSEETVEEYLKKIIDKRHKEIVSAKVETDLQQMDFSFDHYINCLKKELVVEKGRPLKKVINGLGTVYSKYIGERFYSKEIIDNFETVFLGYNNLELDEEKSESVSIDNEIDKLLKQVIFGKDFLIVNNLSSSLYLIIDTLYKDEKVIMSLADTLYLSEKTGFQDIVKKAGGLVELVGYINKLELKDYLKEIRTREELVLYADIFENNIAGVQKLELDDVFKLKNIANILYITNKVFFDTKSDDIMEAGANIDELLGKDYPLYLFDFSKFVGGPEVGVIVGDKELISRMKENYLSLIMSPNKETKVLLYFTLKAYLEKRYNDIYINKCFGLSEEELKEKNRRFVRNLEREIGGKVEISIISGKYLTLDDRIREGYRFDRELVFIKPNNVDAESVEKALRQSDPIILCWLNEGGLIFNLQLISEKSEDIIIDIISKNV